MLGFPIRKFLDQRLLDSFPGLIAACHVLHRLITPRHPPYTLSSLTTFANGPNNKPDKCIQTTFVTYFFLWRFKNPVILKSFKSTDYPI